MANDPFAEDEEVPPPDSLTFVGCVVVYVVLILAVCWILAVKAF